MRRSNCCAVGNALRARRGRVRSTRAVPGRRTPGARNRASKAGGRREEARSGLRERYRARESCTPSSYLPVTLHLLSAHRLQTASRCGSADLFPNLLRFKVNRFLTQNVPLALAFSFLSLSVKSTDREVNQIIFRIFFSR